MNKFSPAIKMIDYSITFFMIIFLISLTNSIFLNQLGYYGALILIITRYFITKENQFPKTGIETALILFIVIEILSAVFSSYSQMAFINVFKRSVLLPIIYITAASATDLKKGKLFFKIYIGASLITVLIYLFFSYQHFLADQYGRTETGPSIFQYPITASEIMSFTVIYFFSFFINEKTSVKNKIFLLIGCLLSSTAVFSTYKRTGWLAVVFGVLMIMVIKKQWKIIIPFAAAGILILLLQKNTSNVHIFSLVNNTLKNEMIFPTNGQANSIRIEDNSYFISDYENGLLEYSNSTEVKRTKLPAPVITFGIWKDDYYYAQLVDTRFTLLKRTSDVFHVKKEFLTRGIPVSFTSFNNRLFILDSDSGLTVFNDPLNLSDTSFYGKFAGYTNIFVDSSFFILFKPAGHIDIFVNEAGVPGNHISGYDNNRGITSGYLDRKRLIISDDAGTTSYIAGSFPVEKNKSITLMNIYKWYRENNKLYGIDLSGNFYLLESKNGTLHPLIKERLDFLPQDFAVKGNEVYVLELKKSRIASILDPYHPSNYGRFALWRAGWEIFKDNPVFGVGDIDLRNYYIKYKRDFDKEIQGHMHNNFIHILVTLGITGLLVVIFLFVKIILVEFRIFYYVENEPFVSSYTLGTIGGFFAFLFAGLTELNFGDHEIITLVWFTIGLNIAFYQHLKREKTDISYV